MKALTLYQPWAWALGRFKWNETRSWTTSYRGPLAIHAGKTVDREFLAEAIEEGYLTPQTTIATGAIVAVGILADCRTTTGAIVNSDEHFWGNYDIGRFIWMFTGIRTITPIPCVGHQGLWDLPDSITAELAFRSGAVEGGFLVPDKVPSVEAIRLAEQWFRCERAAPCRSGGITTPAHESLHRKGVATLALVFDDFAARVVASCSAPTTAQVITKDSHPDVWARLQPPPVPLATLDAWDHVGRRPEGDSANRRP